VAAAVTSTTQIHDDANRDYDADSEQATARLHVCLGFHDHSPFYLIED
jgi:hypothetical protein